MRYLIIKYYKITRLYILFLGMKEEVREEENLLIVCNYYSNRGTIMQF